MTRLENKSKKSGFTIIEVLIVLAIGGLILSIVMMAIPTLQRNGRNNQRKQDVQAILAQVSRYELNNSGNFPPSTGEYISTSNLKLSFYNVSEITTTPKSSGQEVTDVPTVDTVLIVNYQRCSTTTLGTPTTFAAGYSDVVALFAIESGSSGSSRQCQEL